MTYESRYLSTLSRNLNQNHPHNGELSYRRERPRDTMIRDYFEKVTHYAMIPIKKAWGIPIVKRIITNIEWPIMIGIWAFFALIVTVKEKQYPSEFTILLTALAILLVLLTAYNSYRQKSTALLDKYEERFFEKMEGKRKSAARFLLGEDDSGTGYLDLQDVLDFFEAPLARKLDSEEINGFQTYSYFYHWVRLYGQAAQEFIENYQKSEPCAWGSLPSLYQKMSDYEKAEIRRDTGKRCSDEDLVLSAEKLRKYLMEEAGMPRLRYIS